VETLGRIKTRGGVDFNVGDFDSMPYLLAVGKVCLEKSVRQHEFNAEHMSTLHRRY
jgi:hypothetical protein